MKRKENLEVVPRIVNKIWNLAGILRDSGVSYSEYVNQITYLLFLKLICDSETESEGFVLGKAPWESLRRNGVVGIVEHYSTILSLLSKEPGIVGTIFRDARNEFTSDDLLAKMISLIDSEDWASYGSHIKGDIYESLLQKSAEEVKSGSGQYFTPRPLINAIVQCIDPKISESIIDPACGTGGFLIEAFNYLNSKKGKRSKAVKIRGVELVQSVARLASMNVYLHGIGDNEVISVGDSLAKAPTDTFDIVLANPPFGKKSHIRTSHTSKFAGSSSEVYIREDFWVSTNNKQLSFIQHITSLLKKDGRAAIIISDSVLFETGASEKVRRHLLKDWNVHTILRLPTGIFYATGVKSSVIFINGVEDESMNNKDKIWIYDLRYESKFSLRENPIRDADLADFILSFKGGKNKSRVENARFKSFSKTELLESEAARLDPQWLSQSSETSVHNSTDEILNQIIDQFEKSLKIIRSLHAELKSLDE